MLKAKGLPGCFWGEAVTTAEYLLNRCPTKSVDGMTPFEAWHGKKPAMQHLSTFSCIAYVRNTTPNLKKLEDRGRKMIFIGYERGSKAYHAYDPVTKRVHVTRDVVFDEEAQWDSGSGEATGESIGNNDVFMVEYSVANQESPVADEAPAVADGELTPPPHAGGGAEPEAHGEVEFASPPSEAGDLLDVDHDDDAPLRFRKLDNIIGPASPLGFAPRALIAEELHAMSSDETASFAEAERSPSWRKAMMEEIESIEDNKTWSLADLPCSHRAIGLKWVFKVKRDERRVVSKHKARLVVKGYA